MRLNYEKHFQEDDKFEGEYELPYKSLRYARKLTMRNNCAELKPEQFLQDPEYKDLQIWDLKYISTSDEEDNDSSESSSNSEEEESDDEEESKK